MVRKLCKTVSTHDILYESKPNTHPLSWLEVVIGKNQHKSWFCIREISLVPILSKCPVMSKLNWINAKPWKLWCHNDPNTFRYAAGAPCSSNNLIRLKLSGSSCWKTSAAKPGKHAWHTKLLSANIPPTQSHTLGTRVTSCSFWEICCRSRTWNIKISRSNNHTHPVIIISNAHQKSNRVFSEFLMKKKGV